MGQRGLHGIAVKGSETPTQGVPPNPGGFLRSPATSLTSSGLIQKNPLVGKKVEVLTSKHNAPK